MHRVLLLIVRLAMLGGLLGCLAAHSQGVMRPVSFVGLADGESYTAGSAMVRVANDARQGAELARLADRPDLVERLAAVDFGRHKVIGVFAGPMGTSGHGLALKSVLAGPNAVRIVVELTPPLPDQNASDVISFPYAIVAVPKAEIPARGAWSVMSTEGEQLIGPRKQ